MTHRRMMAEMSAEELVEWQLLYRENPFGYQRLELIAGRVGARLANLLHALATGEIGKEQAADYLLDFSPKEPPKPQDWRHMQMVCKALVEAGAKKKRG